MVNIKLASYIKRHIEKGYSKEEISNILKKNGWDRREIDDTFKVVISQRQITVENKPTQLRVNLEPTKESYLNTLKLFISKSRSKGISDLEIKNALRAKKWPDELLNTAFSSLTPSTVAKPIQENLQKPIVQKQREPFNYKLLAWYIVAFLVTGLILTGTIFVYYYVIGLSQYTVVQDGEELHGRCLELDCSDMKDSAFGYAKNNLNMMLIVSTIASLLIVSLYAFLPVRNTILWTVNILYFLLLVFIGVRWIMFNRSI